MALLPPGPGSEPSLLTDDELDYLEGRARNDIGRVRPAHVLSLVAEVRRLRSGEWLKAAVAEICMDYCSVECELTLEEGLSLLRKHRDGKA